MNSLQQIVKINFSKEPRKSRLHQVIENNPLKEFQQSIDCTKY